jgi:hypothetical protein
VGPISFLSVYAIIRTEREYFGGGLFAEIVKGEMPVCLARRTTRLPSVKQFQRRSQTPNGELLIFSGENIADYNAGQCEDGRIGLVKDLLTRAIRIVVVQSCDKYE